MTDRSSPLAGPGERPRVTYIVAAFNAEATLGAALESLLRQDRGQWAAVVVDDGSTDRTLETARAFGGRDDRVAVRSQPNAGAAAARNAGAADVRSDFIACLDADDELAVDHLSTMLALADREPGFDLYSSDGYFVRSDGTREPVFGYTDVHSVSLRELLAESLILGGGTLIRTSVFRALGGFRPEIYLEDYDLWLRALAAGHAHIATPERLYLYHLDVSGQKSEDKVAGIGSAVTALSDLVASGLLSDAQCADAEAGIAKYRAALALERDAARLRALVERRFGTRAAPAVLRALHAVSWVVRPVRRALARRAAGADRVAGSRNA